MVKGQSQFTGKQSAGTTSSNRIMGSNAIGVITTTNDFAYKLMNWGKHVISLQTTPIIDHYLVQLKTKKNISNDRL